MDRLSNTVRPYAWGSTTAIPELLGIAPTGEPQAEMWMGAHPGAPSRLTRTTSAGEAGRERPLTEVIAADPERELGRATVEKFGPRLPFLLKLLAAGAPLSLQVHPDLAQAKQGYEDEERRSVPIDAPHRTYKDANHKPELICALTPFAGLCGFRRPTEAAETMAALGVDSLKPYVDLLGAHPEEAALREVLTAILAADPTEMAETVNQAAAAAERLGGTHAPYARIAHHFPGDPGVIAAMLLNYVELQPGEALFLGAGVPHAYLDGLGVEIMANSDNVLRCGLTPKHVDVPELLRIVRFEATDPGVLRPEASPSGEELYETPVDEFRLSRFDLSPGADPVDLTRDTPQILLCTAGAPKAGTLGLAPGASVFVPSGERVEVSGTGTLFRATVVA
ncbi:MULTISPECIES: mannose-6-phosphate isomerase, class I [unclassified Streptomyces]|uniref:mannose-6-phosphate isomerase, class I n=1 Tax=unclassified Streptomyces TaxID=2593676 RepID=UPI002256E123|nr:MULTISPECIES: mannose-6-phosphate isomerase, class I [unclassified Streptomyces]WSP55416.1 mannose-6-phosphate isomerase, class I [Streptomyces sp. NBC_01241]WSU23853.1 mannose-6-phosphate isomerase, class I [Streptomyces sp. NBC_01108]MCX4787098.1 mannose-6-phosphate isomerase, class I [Streptomyces sp. NBC_01221]MCX4797121.1 mannose-6-phosphate isomerase, class I [Streptomyces sp. NBC_01242]WSJ38418.1 mannose-6-phosphate isomerase, class I [Streptomyces sp. NBC_01321]